MRSSPHIFTQPERHRDRKDSRCQEWMDAQPQANCHSAECRMGDADSDEGKLAQDHEEAEDSADDTDQYRRNQGTLCGFDIGHVWARHVGPACIIECRRECRNTRCLLIEQADGLFQRPDSRLLRSDRLTGPIPAE